MPKTAEIIEYLCEQVTPSRLPGAWEALPCDPPLFDLPADHAELLRRLQERFALRDLLSARVVQRVCDNRVALSSLLTSNASYLYPLRKPHAKKPFDLMAGAGGTLMGQWPLAAALDDAEISARVDREWGRLFIADSAVDVAILRSLPLPVAPSFEVERLAGERLELFCAKLRLPVVGLRESGPDEAARKSRSNRGQVAKPRIPLSVILVNWRLSQLNLDDVQAMLAACSHLRALEERLGIPLDDFAIWKPSVARLPQLQFALECGTPAHVREVLLDGFEDDCIVLDRWPPIERHEPAHWRRRPAQGMPRRIRSIGGQPRRIGKGSSEYWIGT